MFKLKTGIFLFPNKRNDFFLRLVITIALSFQYFSTLHDYFILTNSPRYTFIKQVRVGDMDGKEPSSNVLLYKPLNLDRIFRHFTPITEPKQLRLKMARAHGALISRRLEPETVFEPQMFGAENE